jgi:membrane-bound inhibitor of C-type lysozyme
MKILLAALPILALAACTTNQTNPATGQTMATKPGKTASSGMVYTCDDGTAFTARFQKDTAFITPAGGSRLALPRATSASGIKYETPQHTFWGKGPQATWTVGKKAPTTCRTNQM